MYIKKIGERELIALIAACTALLFIADNSFAQSGANKEEEQPFTKLQSIQAGEKNNNAPTPENKTYDDPATIKTVDISGNSLVQTNEILNRLDIKPGEKFDRDLVQENLKKIYNMGYFTEKIKAVPEQTPTGITLKIQVEENVPVTGFNISGNKALERSEIMPILNRLQGMPQNLSELNNAIKDIEKHYQDKGYILARVKKVSDDPDGLINIEINEGYIQEIEISGNTKTKDFVIKRNLTVESGEVYNENKLKQDMARLFGTQSFSDVRRVIAPSSHDPDKFKLTIEVDEKRTGSISLGGGIDTETGFFGTVGYADTNFRGVGQELNANATLGSGIILSDRDVIDKAPLQLEVNFVEPRLKNTLNSLRVTGFARDLASYQVPLSIEKRYGFETELTRPIKRVPNLAGGLSMGVEHVKMKEGDGTEILQKFSNKGYSNSAAMTERANQLKAGTYISFGPSAVYDTRNSILNPTSGWHNTASFKQSIGIDGGAGSFGRISASSKKYIPIGEKSTFIIGTRISSRVTGNMPEFAQFRLGGPYSIRGFREGNVGSGKGFMMGTAEVRTPLPYLDRAKYRFIRDIRLAGFMDAGKVFKKNIGSDLYNLPGFGISAGTGLIVPIPMLGPMRFDYAYPLTHIGAGNKRAYFSFAVGER